MNGRFGDCAFGCNLAYRLRHCCDKEEETTKRRDLIESLPPPI
jgi:hypothetical protein